MIRLQIRVQRVLLISPKIRVKQESSFSLSWGWGGRTRTYLMGLFPCILSLVYYQFKEDPSKYTLFRFPSFSSPTKIYTTKSKTHKHSTCLVKLIGFNFINLVTWPSPEKHITTPFLSSNLKQIGKTHSKDLQTYNW